MAYVTAYPGAVDAYPFTTPGADRAGAVTESDSINRALIALMAIQTELGISPKGAFSSVAARLAGVVTSVYTSGDIAGNGTVGNPLGINNEVWAGAIPIDTYAATDYVIVHNVGINVVNRIPITSFVGSGGSSTVSVQTKTANYTVVAADDVILGNTAGGSFTVTLPTAVGVTKAVIIKKTASANVLNIATTSAQTVDGSTTIAIAAQYQSLTVVSDGANWNVI